MHAPDVREQSWFDREGYPFASNFLEVPGGRLHFLDEGKGPVLLMIHGTPSWSYDLRALVRHFSKTFRCIVPDHLGFGLSDRPQDWSYKLPDHTANIRALLDHLHVGKLTLLVHDFGGPVALPLALDEPERVEQLIIINSWMWPFGSVDEQFRGREKIIASGFMRWLYRHANFSARVIARSAWGKHSPLSSRHHRHYWGLFPDAASRRGTVGFLQSMTQENDHLQSLHDRTARIRDIRTLLLWGGADSFVTTVHLKHWQTIFSRAQTHVFEKVGHFPQDEAPALVIEKMEKFFASATT